MQKISAFVLGLLVVSVFPRLPQVIMCLSIALGVLLVPRLRFKGTLCAFFLGISWAVYSAQSILAWQLPERYQGQDLQVSGTVLSLPQNYGRSRQFLFYAEKIRAPDGHVLAPTVLRLNVYGKQAETVQLGEHWQFFVRLKRPHGLSNPGSVNKERWFYTHGVRATGYVVNKKPQHHLVPQSGYALQRLRQRIYQAIEAHLSKQPLSGLIAALSVGAQSGIRSKDWQVLRRTGTSHLMAISGLHIGLVASLVGGLFAVIYRRLSPLPLFCGTPMMALYSGFLGALAYGALAGFSVSTQRALWMLIIFVIISMKQRSIRKQDFLVLAAGCVLVINPAAALQPGFWLSFIAVGFIFYVTEYRLPEKSYWRGLRIHAALLFGMLPWSLFFFHQSSWISPLANVIAIPWVSLIVVPLILVSMVLLIAGSAFAGFFLWLAHEALWVLWQLLQAMATWPGSHWQPPLLSNAGVLILAGGMTLWLAPRGFPGRWLGILGLLPLFFPNTIRPAERAVWLNILDVGQGLAVVVETQHHVMVYDTGVKLGPNYDRGRSVVLPFLQSRAIDHIDTLVLSHEDNDHSGGARSVIHALPVHTVFTSFRFRGVKTQHCYAGHHWQWDGVDFIFLHPKRGMRWRGNNHSCVLKVTTGDKSFLLTGDIEAPVEATLIKHFGQALKTDILVVPHHGSKTSSTLPWVEYTHPRYAVISNGYLNSYHLPHPSIVRRYQQQGAYTVTTAQCGAMQFHLQAQQQINMTCYRQKHPHYWQMPWSHYKTLMFAQ